MLSITVILHGRDDAFQNLRIVDLVIEVIKPKTFVISILNEDYGPLIHLSTPINNEHMFVFVTIFP